MSRGRPLIDLHVAFCLLISTFGAILVGSRHVHVHSLGLRSLALQLEFPGDDGQEVPNANFVVTASGQNAEASGLDVDAINWHVAMVHPINCTRSHFNK